MRGETKTSFVVHLTLHVRAGSGLKQSKPLKLKPSLHKFTRPNLEANGS